MLRRLRHPVGARYIVPLRRAASRPFRSPVIILRACEATEESTASALTANCNRNRGIIAPKWTS